MDREGGAHANLAFHRNTSSVRVDHIFDNFGPQPRPFLFGRDGPVAKQAIPHFGTHAPAVIRHGDQDLHPRVLSLPETEISPPSGTSGTALLMRL